jgi:hypothetical protein
MTSIAGSARRQETSGGKEAGESLLLALAPWPVLLRILHRNKGCWQVWGSVPGVVSEYLRERGVTVLDDSLPRPLHRHTLPDSISHQRWSRIIIPALGHPIPTRWPVIRHMATLGARLFVSSDGELHEIPQDRIPQSDPYTWALDRLFGPTSVVSGPVVDETVTIRADLLGDIVLAIPALAALAQRRPTRVVTREVWVPWLRALMCHSPIGVTGLRMDPWHEPVLPACTEVVDMSPADNSSPLTPALVHATAASRRVKLDAPVPGVGLAQMLAEKLDVDIDWPPVSMTEGSLGLLLPSGSSWERSLPPESWLEIRDLATAEFGVTQWMIAGVPDHDPMIAGGRLRGMSLAPYPLDPTEFIHLARQARIVIGVSSGLSHAASISGTPTLVIEHPTTIAGLYRIPSAHARYIRPSQPWWQSQPTDSDLLMAFTQADSYGFRANELLESVAAELAMLRKGLFGDLP